MSLLVKSGMTQEELNLLSKGMSTNYCKFNSDAGVQKCLGCHCYCERIDKTRNDVSAHVRTESHTNFAGCALYRGRAVTSAKWEKKCRYSQLTMKRPLMTLNAPEFACIQSVGP